jgi:hypothetical protein
MRLSVRELPTERNGNMTILRVGGVTAAASVMVISSALAAPAHAQAVQDGLVNVAVGDVTVQDINIGVAAQVVAQACGLKVGPVAVLATIVDRTGVRDVVCTVEDGDVVLTQN